MFEKYMKQVHTDLAVRLKLLPASELVQTPLQRAKRARTEAEPKIVPPPLLGRWAWPTDLPYAVRDCGPEDLLGMVWALGARIVNCLTISPSSNRFAVTAVPLLDPFPGLPEVPYSIKRDGSSNNEPPEAITALVLLAWAMWRGRNHDKKGYRPLRLLTVHHKAMFTEEAGLEWWAHACSCDRAAICLIDKATADELEVEAIVFAKSRPKKPRRPYLYAYLGGGVTFQPDEVSTIVVRTGDADLLAAVVAAAQLASKTWPSGHHWAVFEPDLVCAQPGEERLVLDMTDRVNTYAVNAPPGEAARDVVRRIFRSVPRGLPVDPRSRLPPESATDIIDLVRSVIDLDDPVLLGDWSEALEDGSGTARESGHALTRPLARLALEGVERASSSSAGPTGAGPGRPASSSSAAPPGF